MHLKVINYDDIFDSENIISSTDYIVGGKKERFNDNGLFSEKIFGENGDDTSIDKIGWITFDNFKIISPLFFERLKKVFKNKNLNKMLMFEVKSDEYGNIVPTEENSIFVKTKKDGTKPNIYDPQNIGIPGFINNFETILDLYGKKDIPEYQIVLDAYNNGLLFIDKFPVISSKLRPAMIIKGSKRFSDEDKNKGKTSIKYDNINSVYNFVLKTSNTIKELMREIPEIKSVLELDKIYNEFIKNNDKNNLILYTSTIEGIYPLIYNLQDYCNQVTIYIINNFLKEKKGVLRNILAGTRVNHSARNVLTPRLKGNINDVELPYLTFLELYRFLIINMMVKTEGISFNEADEIIQESKRCFNRKIYNYMNELIKNSKYGLCILLNRNPTIAIGSIVQLNVAAVKEDITDLTISISNNVLTNLNADYDG